MLGRSMLLCLRRFLQAVLSGVEKLRQFSPNTYGTAGGSPGGLNEAPGSHQPCKPFKLIIEPLAIYILNTHPPHPSKTYIYIYIYIYYIYIICFCLRNSLQRSPGACQLPSWQAAKGSPVSPGAQARATMSASPEPGLFLRDLI